jgi:hypothetical protein
MDDDLETMGRKTTMICFEAPPVTFVKGLRTAWLKRSQLEHPVTRPTFGAATSKTGRQS